MRLTSFCCLATLLAAGLARAQWVNYPESGIPRGPDGQPDLTAPAPHAPGGKTDLSGIWIPSGMTFFGNLAAGLQPGDVLPLPWAAALQQQRETRNHQDDPLARCLPQGVPRINTNGMFPFKIIQTPKEVVILYEEMNLFRQVFMDGRKLEPNPNPTWLGYSTGKWDGDTLVVETTGFNGKIWLDTGKGHPASDALHVTERFQRPNFGSLEIRATIDDPKTYQKPWTTQPMKFRLILNTEILEYVCNENEKDLRHFGPAAAVRTR
ncbi:MAG TPA: hypothetical protein VJ732_15795 [Bryobacteraceae bacterium]|nr:hypothetical protein [Bryobacteraceae bacterium]